MTWVVGDTLVVRFSALSLDGQTPVVTDDFDVSVIRGDGSESVFTTAGTYTGAELTLISPGVPESPGVDAAPAIFELRIVLNVSGQWRVRSQGLWETGGTSWPSKQAIDLEVPVGPDPHTFTTRAAI